MLKKQQNSVPVHIRSPIKIIKNMRIEYDFGSLIK